MPFVQAKVEVGRIDGNILQEYASIADMSLKSLYGERNRVEEFSVLDNVKMAT